MPGGLEFRCADAGQQVLLPQEPLAVGTTLTQLYRVRGYAPPQGMKSFMQPGSSFETWFDPMTSVYGRLGV